MFSTSVIPIVLLQHLSYVGLFGLLAGGAVILPIPEEITLLTAGCLVAIGFLNVFAGIAVSVAGLLAGDCILFALARLGTTYAHKLRTQVNKIGLEKTWLFAPSQPLRPVFILRFLTGIRFIAPIYAGFEEASWNGYLITDILSIIIYVPIMFWLGWYFHSSIIAFVAGFELVRHTIFVIVLAFAGAGMLPTLYRKFIKKS